MMPLRRIFVSGPRTEHLDERREILKWAIVREIEALGYEAQMFGSPEGGRGLARQSWSPKAAEDVMQRCVGAAILGFPIWQCSGMMSKKSALLVTEYCHYEGAIARIYGLPILAVLEEGVEERVVFNRYGSDPIIRVPAAADSTWTTDSSFRHFLNNWRKRISERKDIFLAYSGKQEGAAKRIQEILTHLGATVLDWREDFEGGPTILEQVKAAAQRTSGGIFLFTRDDLFKGETNQAGPRDNVIFEAGFFMQAKGHRRVLIIREDGAKLPADLGGVIYESFTNKGLEERLELFLKKSIWSMPDEPSAAADVGRATSR